MSRNAMCTFPFKKCNERLFDPRIKNDTSSGDMDEKVDHWFDSFEIFHKNSPIISEYLSEQPSLSQGKYLG